MTDEANTKQIRYNKTLNKFFCVLLNNCVYTHFYDIINWTLKIQQISIHVILEEF